MKKSSAQHTDYACNDVHLADTGRHLHKERATRRVIVLTLVTMVLEIGAGLAFNSMALLADGFHMGTHAGALGVTAFAYWFARSRAGDTRYAFGTGKVTALGGFASAVSLILVALLIAGESLWRFVDPAPIAYGWAMAVAFVGLVVNGLSFWMLGGHHHHGHGHGHGHGHDHDTNLRAATMHVLADALTSVLAIVALACGAIFGWWMLDPIMGLVGAAVICRWGYGLIGETGSILLDHSHDHSLANRAAKALTQPGDCEVADLHIWRIGECEHALVATLRPMDGSAPLSAQAYRERLADVPGIAHTTIEVVAGT